MIKLRLLAALAMLSGWGSEATAGRSSSPGQIVLRAAFEPASSFEGDLTGGDDELVLTAIASARDDFAPAYSLAIAYRCIAADSPGEYQCGYTARMLRTGVTDEERFGRSLELVAQARTVKAASEMRRRLDHAALQWLEADVDACPKGILAMDSVRVADWNPDVHYALQNVEDRELIMHPASIRVRMTGSYATSTYEGWVFASGVPTAVRELAKTLEPCWRPSKSPRPWNRR